MTESPYIRHHLWATQSGAVDPQAELEAWVSETRELLDATDAVQPEPRCFYLIANYGRIRRLRTELLDEQDLKQVKRELERHLGTQSEEWTNLALQVPNPPAWLSDVKVFDEAIEESDNLLTQAETACNLIEDLDAVDLVCWFARTRGLGSKSLEQELEQCHFRLALQPGTFLPASVYVQAVGQLLRPDLPDFDRELARTAQKFIVLLDEFLANERDIALVDQPQLPSRILSHLHEIRSQSQGRTIRLSDFRRDWPLSDMPMPESAEGSALAASDDPDVESVRRRHAVPAMRYAPIDWPGPAKLVAVYDGHSLTLLCFTESDDPPPALYRFEPQGTKEQVVWKPSPVRSRLYRAGLGSAHKTISLESAAEPRPTITITE